MAGEIYANNVAKLQNQLQSLQQDQITSTDQLQADATDSYNSKMDDYVDKWKTIQDAGGEELAAMLGVKGVVKGTQKLYGIYQNLKGSGSSVPDDANVENMGDAVEEATKGGSTADVPMPSSSTAPLPDSDSTVVKSTSYDMARPTEADLEADPFQPTANQPVSSSFVTGGTSDGGTAASGAAGDLVGDAVADTAPEVASGLSGFLTVDSVVSAIPVVGEIAAGVGGLVAIGDAIYHLFHKPSDKPSVPTPPPLNAPTQVTQQYSSALPSTDASTQRAASSSVF